MNYLESLIYSMEWLGKKTDTVFLGQSVKYSGNAIYNTLKTVPDEKKLETPVFEDQQMGISIGLSLMGYIPISCYPRFDFLILAFKLSEIYSFAPGKSEGDLFVIKTFTRSIKGVGIFESIHVSLPIITT